MEESPPDLGKDSRNSAGARRFEALPEMALRYLEARGILLSVEGQEAVQHLLSVVLRGVIGAIFAFTGWLLLMAAVVAYLESETGWSWVLVTAVVGLVNLILAGIFAFAASHRLGTARWFEHTLSEFGKDRAWLGQLNDRH